MTEYIRALHANPEKDNYADDIPNESLPGCGNTVLLEYDEAPPVQEGDIFEDNCPSCDRLSAKLEVLEVQR